MKSRDFDHLRYIKRDDQKVLMKDNAIKERCREYLNKLLNEDSKRDLGTRINTPLAK